MAHVSSTINRSSSDKSCPRIPSNEHICPLKQVLVYRRGAGATSVISPKSTANSEIVEHLPPIPSLHQHNRYSPPAADNVIDPQLTLKPLRVTDDSSPLVLLHWMVQLTTARRVPNVKTYYVNWSPQPSFHTQDPPQQGQRVEEEESSRTAEKVDNGFGLGLAPPGSS